jgi:HAD superfamily hydrolase (TIGR01549 family)
MSLQGVIFDLDGTLVDSRLDFNAIRREMQIPDGQPILEALDEMPEGDYKSECLRILKRHEQAGAEQATLIPGVREFLSELTRRDIRQGVLTRNSRESTQQVTERLGLEFSIVLTREDAPPKPDPKGLLLICEKWGISVERTIFIGDYLFDLQAGRNAEIRGVLYCPGDLPEYANEADFVIRDFSEAHQLIDEFPERSV